MELNVRVVCRHETAPGFALAGLVADEAQDGPAAALALKRLTSDREVGLVLIEDRLHREISPELLARLDRQGMPIVAPFPSPRWDRQGLAEEYVLEILRRAIGYRVRPR